MRYLIKNGTIYDGKGEEPYAGDILIAGDRVVDIKQRIEVEEAKIIPADGMVVTPGFVDIHRHCDISSICDKNFGTLELAQGITSVVGGNCGLAPVPSVDRTRKELNNFNEPCLGIMAEEIKLKDFSAYMQVLEKTGLNINVGALAATGAIKVAARGYDKGRFTNDEMDVAKKYLREALEAGALGVSTGIMYSPECYSTDSELISLLEVAAQYKATMSCHIRGEGDSLVTAVEEVINIAAKSGIALNISHFKSIGVKNWNRNIFQAIELVEKARSKGMDITVDFYPYTGGATTLISLIPIEFMEEDIPATLRKLSTTDGKEQLKKMIYMNYEGWDNMVTAIGWDRIFISSVSKLGNQGFSGKSIALLAEENGYADASDFISDLLVEEEGKVGIIVLSMSQEDVDIVAKLPYSFVISDALYGKSDSPHPRLYGTFPKIIREYVLERGILTMEEAIKKMTYLPAKRMNIRQRGFIENGCFADINIFDPNEMKDHAIYNDSKKMSTGMRYVLVNGQIAWVNEKKVKGNSGITLKRI